MNYLDYIKATSKTVGILSVMVIFWILNFPAAFLVALTAKRQEVHPMGKDLVEPHSDKYIRQGSSGIWEYWNSNVKLLKWFNNYEDGLLREPSGKNSAAVNGKERTVWAMTGWGWRNPFNWGKRTLPLFHCMVNECDVTYVGDYRVEDKDDAYPGWYFVKAVHRVTKRSYYGARWVKHYGNGKVRQAYIGFKLKPSHKDTTQSFDDLDKAFTVRFPVLQSTR